MSTIFEKIVKGEMPADIVYQDELVTAFRDINPITPVHLLIVPNHLIPTVNDITEADEPALGRMLYVAKKLAAENGIAENGFRLMINCNEWGGQTVFHLHLHILGGRPLGELLPPDPAGME